MAKRTSIGVAVMTTRKRRITMIVTTVIKPAKLASADEAPCLEKTFLFEQIYLGRTLCLQFLQVTKDSPTKPFLDALASLGSMMESHSLSH